MLQIPAVARLSIKLIIVATASFAAAFAAIFIYLGPKLPDVDTLLDARLQTPLRIYSRDGLLIGEFGEKRRAPVSYQEVPQTFINAILAAEDDRFFDHHGVDITGLLRAASQLIVSGEIQTGGSTITMQVAKNYFLSQERTFSRKFNEIFLALKIENSLSKAQIMELYLNKIFLGNHAYGIQAAAQVYYGTTIDQLNLAQAAMIAGLPKAPSAYNPIVNPVRAKQRRNWILGRMYSLDYITREDYEAALESPITATYHGTLLEAEAAYVAEMARREMISLYGVDAYTDGYHVYTTIDSGLQKSANRAVLSGVAEYDWRHGYRGPEQHLDLPEGEIPPEDYLAQLRGAGTVAHWLPALVTAVGERSFDALLVNGEMATIGWEQGLSEARPYIDNDHTGASPQKAGDVVRRGDIVRVTAADDGGWHLSQVPKVQGALVALDADTGAILSLVGGTDYRRSAFNRVTQAERQPGSNFKPFLYAAALDNGFTAATVINDAPIVVNDEQLESTWRPTNDSGRFYGPTRLRQALYNSRNLVSIRLLRELGINNAVNYVERFGFDPRRMPKDLSLALGSLTLTPLQLVEGYAVLANGGFRVRPYLIERILDHDLNEIYTAAPAVVCRECEDEEERQAAEALLAEPVVEEVATIEDILAQEAVPEEAPPRAPRVMDKRTAYIMDSMLHDVIRKGTGRQARKLGREDLGGKTGTTNGPTDVWFSGYGGGIVTTAWVGFDSNDNLGRREYGGSVALPIWMDYMRAALDGRPERELKLPEGLVSVRIDPSTGTLAQPGQHDAIFEMFRSENVPTRSDSSTLSAETHEEGVHTEAVELF